MFPASDQLMPIAQVLKSYGTSGEVLISFLPTMPDDIDSNEPVFFILEGLPVPFFIESFQTRGKSKALVKFEDIDHIKDSDLLLNQKIYYPSSQSIEDASVNLDGYSLYDQNEKLIGVVSHTYDFSNNICIEVEGTLFPLHPELIITLDEEKKELVLEIPEGLV